MRRLPGFTGPSPSTSLDKSTLLNYNAYDITAKMLCQIIFDNKKKHGIMLFLVEEDGFEPSKSKTTDLQSAPFSHSGIPPHMELAIGIEPTTC